MAFHLTFEQDKCKGCELCISVCPKKILGLSEAPNVKGYRPAECKDEAFRLFAFWFYALWD